VEREAAECIKSSCIGECSVHGSVRVNEQGGRGGERERERKREREREKREAPRNEGREDENGATLASDGDLFLDLPVSSK